DSAFVITFFFSSRRRHTSFSRDWSSDVCSSDLRAWTAGGTRRACCTSGELDELLGDVAVDDAVAAQFGGVPLQAHDHVVPRRIEIGRASCRGGRQGGADAGTGRRREDRSTALTS